MKIHHVNIEFANKKAVGNKKLKASKKLIEEKNKLVAMVDKAKKARKARDDVIKLLIAGSKLNDIPNAKEHFFKIGLFEIKNPTMMLDMRRKSLIKRTSKLSTAT